METKEINEIKINLKIDKDFDYAIFESLKGVKPKRRASYIRLWLTEYITKFSNGNLIISNEIVHNQITKTLHEKDLLKDSKSDLSKSEKNQEIADFISEFE